MKAKKRVTKLVLAVILVFTGGYEYKKHASSALFAVYLWAVEKILPFRYCQISNLPFIQVLWSTFDI